MGVAACPDRPSRHGRGTQKSAVSAAFAGKKDGSLMEARFFPGKAFFYGGFLPPAFSYPGFTGQR